MCNNPCQLCGDLEDCEIIPLKDCLSYQEAMNIFNHELIKREDKSYNEYIKENFNGIIQKQKKCNCK